MTDFLQFLKDYSFLIGALTGSVAAFFLNLFVNYIKRERKILGYSVVSRKIIEGGQKDLEIRYKEKPIKRLYSHQVTIRNVGNRALKDLPVKIKFDDTFIDPELTQPDGAEFTMTTTNDKEIIVSCDLLERNENFKIGFTSIVEAEEKEPKESSEYIRSILDTPRITVIARVEDLECRDLDVSVYPIEPKDLIASVAYDIVKSFVGRLVG